MHNFTETEDAQRDFKIDIKRWLKQRNLNYAWLANQCYVSEITVRNWMAKKSIPNAKQHIIRSLMSHLPTTTPNIEVTTETCVTIKLNSAVQASLEMRAGSEGKTVAELIAVAINNLVDTRADEAPAPVV